MMIHVRDKIYKRPYEYKGRAHNRYFVKTNCRICGNIMYQDWGNHYKGKKPHCSSDCVNLGKSGENAYNFSGGKRYKHGKKGGPLLIYAPKHPKARKNWIPEHRLIMEDHLGRILDDNERVHHINMVKDDNRIENLHVFPSHQSHFLAHGSINVLVKNMLESGMIEFDKDNGIYVWVAQ